LDEFKFSHDLEGNKLGVLGLKETKSKEFRLVLTINKDGIYLKICY